MARTASTHSKPLGKRNGIRAQRAFSPVELLNLWEPNGAWQEYRGLGYGEGPRQRLDVYKPRHTTKAPTLVFFYGGSGRPSCARGGSKPLCEPTKSLLGKTRMISE